MTNMLYSSAVCVQRKYLATLSQQMDKIASMPASCIEYTHSVGNVPSKDLIEDVDVDMSELFLNV
ncbi:hypothetical protein [Edaphobacter aggregans]|uniref:hypothetical protein n=1 Tax=Edaphobacter aggregans TaxID=570835 RepID=UPI00054E0196